MTRAEQEKLIFLLTVTIVTISIEKVDSKPGCDLEKIFQTPKRLNYDHLEILERANFENNEKNQEAIQPITHQPKSFANAQVLLRFNGGNPGKPPCDFYPPHPCPYCQKHYHPPSCACGRHCKCRQNLPMVYPIPVAIPICFYYNHNPLKFYNFPSQTDRNPYDVTTIPTFSETDQPERTIIPITNNHPEILHPIRLTTTECLDSPTTPQILEEPTEEEQEETEEPATTTNVTTELETEPCDDHEDEDDEKCLEDSINDEATQQNNSEIIVNNIESTSYDPTASKEESNIKYVNIDVNEQSSESLRENLGEEEDQGKKDDVIIPVMPNCNNAANNQYWKKKQNQTQPIIRNSLLDLLVPRIVEELLSRKVDHLIQEPKYHYSGYKMSAGSGYYSDPTKTVLYRQPTVIKVVKSPPTSSAVGSQQLVPPQQVLTDSGYHNHYPHGKSCRCISCNNYVRELNE